VLNIGFLTTKARGSSPQFQAKIDRLEYRGRQEIGCNPRTIRQRGRRAVLPAAPSSIRISDRLALQATGCEKHPGPVFPDNFA